MSATGFVDDDEDDPFPATPPRQTASQSRVILPSAPSPSAATVETPKSGNGADHSVAPPILATVALPAPPEPPAPPAQILARVAIEIDEGAHEGAHQNQPNSDESGDAPDEEELPQGYSEDHLTEIFSDRHGQDWRYIDGWSSWRHWNGAVWEKDNTLAVYDIARKITREVSNLAPALTVAQRRVVASARTVAAIERLARSARAHAASVEQWDADTMALSTPSGVINLRTGSLRPAKREDYATKSTLVAPLNLGDPGLHCPVWIKSLQRWCGNDIDLEMYLQRFAGYCLTGITTEHALAFFYGTGRNGKSVFLDAIREIMGDYAKVASMEMFQASQQERHSTEIAGLMGARLVTAQETQEGRRWDEAKIKELTSATKINARFMRQDFFEYTPQFKLFFAGNHKPGLRSVDEAMKARVHIVPFTITIPESERDQRLSHKLRAEYPGILQWMIDGCREWQTQGLNPPAAVKAATDDYMQSEDSFAEWIEECCELNLNAAGNIGDLYKSYKAWTERVNEFTPSAKRFGQTLESRGYSSKKIMGYRRFYGIGLRQKPEIDSYAQRY